MNRLIFVLIIFFLLVPGEILAQDEAWIGLFADGGASGSIFYPTGNVNLFVLLRPMAAGNTRAVYKLTSTNPGVFFHSAGSEFLHHTLNCDGTYEIADPPTSCTWSVEYCGCYDPSMSTDGDDWILINVINVEVTNFDGAYITIEEPDGGLRVYGCDRTTTYPLIPMVNATLWGPVAVETESWGAIKSMYR